MRYLIATASVSPGNVAPDSVHLGLYESGEPSALVKQATADNLQGAAAIITDDVIDDGVIDSADERWVQRFAQQYLAFDWFSGAAPFDKHLKIFAEDFDSCGVAQTVRLHFYLAPDALAFSAGYQTDADGKGMELTIFPDVNGDKQIDYVDAQLVRQLALNFLALRWYGTHEHTFCQLQLFGAGGKHGLHQ